MKTQYEGIFMKKTVFFCILFCLCVLSPLALAASGGENAVPDKTRYYRIPCSKDVGEILTYNLETKVETYSTLIAIPPEGPAYIDPNTPGYLPPDRPVDSETLRTPQGIFQRVLPSQLARLSAPLFFLEPLHQNLQWRYQILLIQADLG